MDNGIYSTSTASYDSSHISSNSESVIPTTATTTTDVPQAYYSYAGYPATLNSESAPTMNYGSFAGYPNSDSYGYSNTNNNYAGYYSGYQQQHQQQQQPQVNNQSYAPQQLQQQGVGGGVYQSNTGAAPTSSFQITALSASANANANYSTCTYYNPHADYQSGGGLGGYGNQNAVNLWQPGSFGAQYPGYGVGEANRGYGSTNIGGGTAVQYQQHYKQWADYYTSQTEVTCAPGTENVVTATSSGIVGVPGGYALMTCHQSATYSAPWKAEATTDFASAQPSVVSSSVHDDGYWKQGTPGFRTNAVNSTQSNLGTPMDSNPMYGSFQEQHKPEYLQAANVHYPDHHVTQNYHTSLQRVHQSVQQSVSQTVQQPVSQIVQRTVPQTVVPLDLRLNKMQIPKNPRITTNVGLGFSKTDKENSVSSATAKPVYISVAPPKANDQMSSHNAADSVLKPDMFPKSLRGYVERALSRCKDDTQMAACQTVMKEVITKATADGTLYTRDWDTEPLLPLFDASTIINEMIQSSTPDSSLVKNRRSPSRRTKSRWEPLSVEKSVDKQTAPIPDVKSSSWFNLREDSFSAGKLDKEYNRGNLKFPSTDQKVTDKNPLGPFKKPRLGDGRSGGDNGASSDSDPEQNLTAYYPGAIALADTPEERKRRESRSKRFEKARRNRDAKNHFRPKTTGAGTYIRKDSVLVLSNNFDDGNIRPVEDIDWDSLTIKGTCQEIEKGYLRLTSAPDPATVRPEEVLEKALLMVQNSQKNYFYKCDQLKSIRQDLTVQRIRNELTVKVYETHARLAIEVGDMSEYNQCQSQLKVLYAEGNKGCDMEFSAYHLLCVILHSNNNRDLLSVMSRLSVEARKDQAVKHALEVRAAVASGNYVLFFRLYKEAPNLNTCLMDLYVEKMRYAAVKCMCRSYRPTLAVSYIAQVLGFSSFFPEEPSGEKDTDGLEECVEWLKAHGACLITDNSGEMLLDSKSSTSSLFMPEPEDAVSHGDATLAVNDFLTRIPS